MGLGLRFWPHYFNCYRVSRLTSLISIFLPLIYLFSVTGQLWSLSTTVIQCRLRIQLNSILFAKTLVRKDIASSSPPQSTNNGEDEVESVTGSAKKGDDNDFSSKAQIMTLMTTDVDRVSDFSWHLFALVGGSLSLSHSNVLT